MCLIFSVIFLEKEYLPIGLSDSNTGLKIRDVEIDYLFLILQ